MATFGRGSSACMVLNSYHKDCHYEMKEQRGPPHKREYIFGVTVLGVEYLGRGNSKKLAKQAAAASALRSLYSLRLNLDLGSNYMPGYLQRYYVESNCKKCIKKRLKNRSLSCLYICICSAPIRNLVRFRNCCSVPEPAAPFENWTNKLVFRV